MVTGDSLRVVQIHTISKLANFTHQCLPYSLENHSPSCMAPQASSHIPELLGQLATDIHFSLLSLAEIRPPAQFLSCDSADHEMPLLRTLPQG